MVENYSIFYKNRNYHVRELTDNGLEPPQLERWRESVCKADESIDLSEKLRSECPLWESRSSLS